MLKIFFFFLLCLSSILASAPWLNEDKQNSTLTEGDIALEDAPDSSEQRLAIEDYQVHASASSPWNRKWVNNTVPFTLSKSFNTQQRKIILAAMTEIQEKTCISFVGREQETDFILFRKVPERSMCSSRLGREGGRQHVNLTNECVVRDTVLHELMHVLGFQHEHSRHDRHKYININLSNVKLIYKQHLKLIRKFDPMDSLVRYDHKSITHYPEEAFSAYNNSKTIISKVRAVKVKSNGLSEIDIWKIKYIYNCLDSEEDHQDVENSIEHAEETTRSVSNIERTITEISIGTISKMTTSTTTRQISILNKEIINAVKEGNENRVLKFLNEGADVNARIIGEYRNNTLLHIASEKGHVNVVSLLLDKGANIEAKEVDAWTSLHYAARGGHVNVVSLFLDKGANVEARTTSNWTPLHYAADSGHVNVVSLLLEKGANVEAKDVDGWTPLQCAVGYGHVNVVLLLLDKGANIFAKGRWDHVDSTPLDLAKRRNKSEIVEILERKLRQLIETLKMTIATTSRPISILNNEIIKAVEEGNEATVGKLLNEGADVNAITTEEYNSTLLHNAAKKGHKNVVSLLLDKGADIEARNKNNWTPLHFAAQEGHVNVVSLLLEKGANIEAKDIDDWTPLQCAVGYGRVNVVLLLLDKGANIFAKGRWDHVDSTPLDLAKRRNKSKIVGILERKLRQLIETLKMTTSTTTRPISLLNSEIIKAVEEGNEATVRKLLNEGAELIETLKMTDSNIQRVPPNAIGLGQQHDSGTYYLAMAISKYGLIPCKAKAGEAWYSYGGKEISTTNFVWITVPVGYKCALVKSTNTPNRALKFGYQKDRGDVYSTIAHTQDGDIPGKAIDGECWYPFDRREKVANSFSYVVITHDSC